MKKPKESPKLLSVSAFARLVGVDESTVRKAPKSRVRIQADGKIAATEVGRWNSSRDPAKVRPRPGDSRTSKAYENARLRKAVADADLAERSVLESRERLIDRDAVRRAITDFSRTLSQTLMNFPSRFGLQIAAEVKCDARELTAVLEKYMRNQVVELSETHPKAPLDAPTTGTRN